VEICPCLVVPLKPTMGAASEDKGVRNFGNKFDEPIKIVQGHGIRGKHTIGTTSTGNSPDEVRVELDGVIEFCPSVGILVKRTIGLAALAVSLGSIGISEFNHSALLREAYFFTIGTGGSRQHLRFAPAFLAKMIFSAECGLYHTDERSRWIDLVRARARLDQDCSRLNSPQRVAKLARMDQVVTYRSAQQVSPGKAGGILGRSKRPMGLLTRPPEIWPRDCGRPRQLMNMYRATFALPLPDYYSHASIVELLPVRVVARE